MKVNGINIDPASTIKSDNIKSDNKQNNSPGANFGDVLNDAISKVDDLQKESDRMSEKLSVGEVDNVHDVVIASEKAELALNLTVQVRNKLVEAYEEVMRMQI